MYIKLADTFSYISGAGLSAAFSRGNRSQLDRKASRVEVIYIDIIIYKCGFHKGDLPFAVFGELHKHDFLSDANSRQPQAEQTEPDTHPVRVGTREALDLRYNTRPRDNARGTSVYR